MEEIKEDMRMVNLTINQTECEESIHIANHKFSDKGCVDVA